MGLRVGSGSHLSSLSMLRLKAASNRAVFYYWNHLLVGDLPMLVLPSAPSVLPLTPLLYHFAPSMLPLKRPCSLSRTETVISNPKFGVYIIYIHIR